MSTSLRLAETLTARLCHDLSGSLGTLIGAREIAALGGEDAAEAHGLADDAAAELRLRLRLLRAAWGGRVSAMSPAELAELAEGLPNRRRVRVDLSGLDQATPLEGAAARLLLNVMILGVEALPAGGVLAISGSGARDVVASITGPRAAWPTSFTACLADEARAWESLEDTRRLQGPLTVMLAKDCGLRLSLLLGGADAGPPPLLLSLSG